MSSDFTILAAGLALLALYLFVGADIGIWLEARALARRAEAERHLLIVDAMIARPTHAGRRHE